MQVSRAKHGHYSQFLIKRTINQSFYFRANCQVIVHSIDCTTYTQDSIIYKQAYYWNILNPKIAEYYCNTEHGMHILGICYQSMQLACTPNYFSCLPASDIWTWGLKRARRQILATPMLANGRTCENYNSAYRLTGEL